MSKVGKWNYFFKLNKPTVVSPSQPHINMWTSVFYTPQFSVPSLLNVFTRARLHNTCDLVAWFGMSHFRGFFPFSLRNHENGYALITLFYE